MQRFALEMRQLYEQGLEIECRFGGKQVNLRVLLCNVVGDNLGLQTIFGLRGMNCKYFCRFCLATKLTRQRFFKESAFILRNRANYARHCE